MRVIAKTLLLVLTTSVACAGPWEDFVQTRRQRQEAARWILVVPANQLNAMELLKDPSYQKLAAGPDWGVEFLSPPVAQDLKAQGRDWALFDPHNQLAGTGAGHPTGDQLLGAIHSAGQQARFERLAAFLRDHPNQGEARQEAANLELRRLRAQILAQPPVAGAEPRFDGRLALHGADAEARADELFAPAVEALRALTQVPSWGREAHWLASRMAGQDLGQSPHARRWFAELAEDLEARVAADPDDAALVRAWVEALDAARRLPETMSGRIQPVPGEPWPEASLMPSLLEPYLRRRAFQTAEQLLRDLTPAGPPQPLTPHGWEEYCDLRAAVSAQRAALYLAQGAQGEVQASIDDAMAWGGARQVVAALMRRGLTDPRSDTTYLRQLWAQASTRKSTRPAMPAQPAPLRLVLYGHPSWLLAWTALHTSAELAPWAPGELRWEFGGKDAAAKERQKHQWDAHPRWALYRGDDLLAQGQTCPGPVALAGVLAAHGTPMLERLAQVLAQHPDHLAARRARFDLLLKRMPDKRLEPLLAEDAARLQLHLPFGPDEAWHPDPDLWSGAAGPVLAELETQLRSWPGFADLWEAWVSWARFHPARPSIVHLAKDLPYWHPEGDWRAGLPYVVHRAVAAELKRQGQFLQMRDWFQSAWDQLDRRPMKDLRPWERSWASERRTEEETAIYQPLREALRALGMNDQLLELQRQFSAMMEGGTHRSR